MRNSILNVSLRDRSYPIEIGAGLLDEIGEKAAPFVRGRAFVVTDDNVAPLYADKVCAALGAEKIVVKAGEGSKSLKTAEDVLETILARGCDRRTALFSLGGGVVGDLTGFCASVLERGVDFIQIPTTLLAQTDSSVGGKTAVNARAGKNLIGTFYQPKAVFIDTDVLKTLPRRQLLAGYAEVAKYGLILDADFWDFLEQNADNVLSLDEEALCFAVRRSCELKARIVAADEREETGVRALLNYGHTFGHAFEAASGFDILHGEGVAAGCVYAAGLSRKLGSDVDADRIKRHLKSVGLPVCFDSFKTSELLSLMKKDKKTVSDRLNFVCLKAIGRAEVVKDVDSRLVAEVLES